MNSTLRMFVGPNKKLTCQEQRLLNKMSDGLAHSAEELMTCLNDEESRLGLRQALASLRKPMRLRSYDIVVQKINNKTYWRIVQFITDDERPEDNLYE